MPLLLAVGVNRAVRILELTEGVKPAGSTGEGEGNGGVSAALREAELLVLASVGGVCQASACHGTTIRSRSPTRGAGPASVWGGGTPSGTPSATNQSAALLAGGVGVSWERVGMADDDCRPPRG